MRLSIRRHKRLPSTTGVPAAPLRYYEENSGEGAKDLPRVCRSMSPQGGQSRLPRGGRQS